MAARWSGCAAWIWPNSHVNANHPNESIPISANLVFSGLHGALIVLEPTFTAESLAEMLQIPAHKTLLRRHLSSQFNALLGQQVAEVFANL